MFKESAGPERGRYGRLLCYVFADGQNVNLELVRRGWSKYETEYGKSERFHEQFVAAERKAKRAGRGIWGE